MHQNISLGSNGVVRVRSLRKILTRLRGTNFCTSSAHFAPRFVRQPNGPKCTQIVRKKQNVSFGSNGVDRVCEKFRRDFVARTFALVRATKSRRNFSQTRSTPLDPKLTFCFFRTIWVHLGPFGCLTNLGAKWAELVQKFVPRSRVGIFRNKRTRSTPLDSKLMFWFVSYYLGAFRTVWLPNESRRKTGRTSAKVRAMKSCRNFAQRTHPIHPIGP